jgi:ribA/ribD-fused uncharacterized protein
MFRGELDFLSNFYEQSFYCSAVSFEVPTAEHAFMALKTLDPVQREHVLTAATPGAAKRRGRGVTLRPDWDTGARVWAMKSVLESKFAVPDLRERLLATGMTKLVEVNEWHDQFWGDCWCASHVGQPGVNMLGELLMALRTELQNLT